MRRKRNSHTLLVELQIGIAAHRKIWKWGRGKLKEPKSNRPLFIIKEVVYLLRVKGTERMKEDSGKGPCERLERTMTAKDFLVAPRLNRAGNHNSVIELVSRVM